MLGMIQFNANLQKYEGVVEGKIVIKSKNEGRVRYVLKSQFNVTKFVKNENGQETAPIQMPKSEFAINERFEFLTHFVKMIAKKKAMSLVVSGPGGLGKTFTVIETLSKMGMREDTIGSLESDFIVIKGFTTAKGMYRSLWENNGKVIIFDDADSSFRDPIGANILKAALESNERRIISWNAEFSEREELPNRFEFTGRVIFISNMPMEKIPQALISRSMRVSLDMTTDEKVERLETVMKQDNFMPHLDSEVKADVLAFVKKFSKQFSDLNIRTAMNIAQVRDGVESAEVFERMALYMAKS